MSLAVRAENDQLKIQGMDDRRKIQVLLAMTEPVANRVAEPGSIRLYNPAVATARRKNTGSLSIDIAPGLLSPPSSTSTIGPGPARPRLHARVPHLQQRPT